MDRALARPNQQAALALLVELQGELKRPSLRALLRRAVNLLKRSKETTEAVGFLRDAVGDILRACEFACSVPTQDDSLADPRLLERSSRRGRALRSSSMALRGGRFRGLDTVPQSERQSGHKVLLGRRETGTTGRRAKRQTRGTPGGASLTAWTPACTGIEWVVLRNANGEPEPAGIKTIHSTQVIEMTCYLRPQRDSNPR